MVASAADPCRGVHHSGGQVLRRVLPGCRRGVEWLTQKCVEVQHYEPWVEEWEEWVPEQSHTDDKGRTIVDVPGHWETRTAYHPEEWAKVGENGHSISVSEAEYCRIRSEWGHEQYRELQHSDQRHRMGCASSNGLFSGRNHHKCNCSDGRGDMFACGWPGGFETIEAITWKQSWVNRMQASSESVFRFPKINEKRARELFALPDPSGNGNCECILGDGGPTMPAADRDLRRWNAVVGPRPEDKYARACRMWLLVYKGSPSDDDARDQEALWKGGKKNEFTLCLGVDDKYQPTWAYVISWTDAHKLKADVRDYAMRSRGQVDLVKLVRYMGERCKADFVRKRSEEWSYLSVRCPAWSVVLCWALVAVVSCGSAYAVAARQDLI